MTAFEAATHVRPAEGDRPPAIEYTVSAPEFPDVLVELVYLLQGGISLQSVKIYSAVDEEGRALVPVAPGTVRNLPLATWDRALSMRARSALLHPSLYRFFPDVPPAEGTYLPGEAVDKLYPGLAEDATKAGRRRYGSLIKLAQVASEYAGLLFHGEKNPTGLIAEMEGVKPVTVRSWLHRAKAAGFYPLFGLDDSRRRNSDT